MTIEKLHSGSYRITEMYKGKRYRVTVKKKPTKLEAKELIEELTQGKKINRKDMTFEMACNEFFDIKGKVISPSTLKAYKSILKALSEEFKRIKIFNMLQTDIQKEINNYSSTHKPKTTHNVCGFILAVLKTFNPNVTYSITLPQKVKNEPYIPTKEEIKKILDLSKNTEYEIPIWLGCCGLRRSEIIALELNDLSADNILTINSAKVKGDDNQWHKKTTKTAQSTRQIIIPDYVADLIRQKGYFYKGDPNTLWKAMDRYCKDLGLEHIKFHALRHYFATMLTENGVSETDILKMGGWSTPNVMKTVYRHATIDKDRERQKEAINGLF